MTTSTYSLYSYSFDQGEEIYYVNNDLVEQIKFPPREILTDENTGNFTALSLEREIVEVVSKKSGLTHTSVYVLVVDDLELTPMSAYSHLKERLNKEYEKVRASIVKCV